MLLQIFLLPCLLFSLTMLIPVISLKASTSEENPEIVWRVRENIDDTQVISMATTPRYRSLRFLDLTGNPIKDEGVAAIAQNLTKLECLKLTDTELTNEGVLTIARNLTSLKVLDLSHIFIEKSGAKEIGSNLTQLEHLSLVACQLTPSACNKITANLQNLRTLNLAFNYFNHEGMHGLLMKSHPHLLALNLRFNGVRDVEILNFARSSWFSNLRELNLSHNEIGMYGIDYITKNLVKLEALELSHNKVGNAQALRISENLSNLRILNLECNRITSKGAIAMAHASLPNLKLLNLLLNPIKLKGILALEEFRTRMKGKSYIYWGLPNLVTYEAEMSLIE